MFFVAAALCVGIGALVVGSAEEPRIRRAFAVLCAACAVVCIGLWVETQREAWAFFAARVNMTAALVATSAAVFTTQVMCRVSLDRRVLLLLGAAALVNLLTVWATTVYFSGAMVRHPWGVYVAGNPAFAITPILNGAIGLYCLLVLGANYRRTRPLDRNRAKYFFVSYALLAACLLDYLPHFGVDLFGGCLSPVLMPLFVATYGYACLRYRLVAFRALVGTALGWLFAIALTVSAWFFAVELAGRWLAVSRVAPALAGLFAALGVFALVGRHVPRWLRRLVDGPEPTLPTVLHFGQALTETLDEKALAERARVICTEEFGSVSAGVVDGAALRESGLFELAAQGAVIETDVVARGGHRDAPLLRDYELLVPLTDSHGLLGALAVGKRYDDGMYSARALQSLRMFGNVLAVALSGARRSDLLTRRL